MADEVDREEMVEKVEKVRSGDGQEEMAGVGQMDGDGDDARFGGAANSDSTESSIVKADGLVLADLTRYRARGTGQESKREGCKTLGGGGRLLRRR